MLSKSSLGNVAVDHGLRLILQRGHHLRRLRIAMKPLLKLTLGQAGVTPLFRQSKVTVNKTQ